MPRLLLVSIGVAFAITMGTAGAKQRPTSGTEYRFSQNTTKLGETTSPTIIVWSKSISFDQAVFTFQKAAFQEVVTNSESKNLSLSAKKKTATANKSKEQWKSETTLPITVTKNGEYLVHWSATLRKDDKTVGTLAGTIAVLAENGKVWCGADSVELAYVECLKNQLGIKGQPRGSSLTKLNKLWDQWLMQRQVKARN